jgi:hypothetical protein
MGGLKCVPAESPRVITQKKHDRRSFLLVYSQCLYFATSLPHVQVWDPDSGSGCERGWVGMYVAR